MENIAGLWSRLKGQADKILLLGSLAFMGKNIRRIKSGGSQNLKILTPQRHAHRVMHTASCTPRRQLFIVFFFLSEYLGEIESKIG